MAVRVNFEIGNEASIKTKKTPEGFTHDWEVFVRGQEGADISHFVDKVVFHLHETFPKPKRVVKEPPFSVKESGYAGFPLPIEIYLKNRDVPKKIKFIYDLNLVQTGPTSYNSLKDRYIFENPNEDFKKKLLRGGGIVISNHNFYTNPDQESKSRDSFTDEKPQLLSKPKLSGDSAKKHRPKEHKEEVPHRTSSFENLFGPPIQKPPKISPDPKKIVPAVKPDKKDKVKSSSDKDKQKVRHDHKDKSDKVKVKEEKEKIKEEKVNKHNKEIDRAKEKSSKRPSERPPSPVPAKKRCPSPARRPPSPPPRSSSANSVKEEVKIHKPNIDIVKQEKPIKIEEKPPEVKPEKEKKKKEKKSHDRDKERSSKKEHKKDTHKSSKEVPKEPTKPVEKIREVPKEKEVPKETPVKEKAPKLDKPFNKFSIENLVKTPQDTAERLDEQKPKEKVESERKHKHKKKDKKRDESREKHRESSSKEKKHKHDKAQLKEHQAEHVEPREPSIAKERPPPEPTSPISLDTASQCSSKSGIAKATVVGADDCNSYHSESDASVVVEEEIETLVKVENIVLETPVKRPDPTPEPEPVVEIPIGPSPKEKSKKHKDKSSKRDGEEKKRRKRKTAEGDDEESRKVPKTEDLSNPIKTEGDRTDSDRSAGTSETKVQDNGVSSSLGEDAEPGDLSPDYMVQLRELQQRIMTIKSNEELERVVNLIAETGRYEVTSQTFDFDLCLLDRSTVQQLIRLVGC